MKLSFSMPHACLVSALFLSPFMLATSAVVERESPEQREMEAGVLNLNGRLATLNPENPMAYFELAEELSYLSVVMPHQRQTALRMAEQLYVLSFELERARSPQPELGASVCFALADLATPLERDWLLALAASFGTLRHDEPRLTSDERITDDHTRSDAAEALGRFRAVERRPLSAILRRVDVRREMIDSGVTVSDADWAMDKLRRGLDRPYCPECRNQRIVRTGTSDQTIEHSLCTACFGNPEPDPPLSREELVRMLAIEAKLLGANPETWSAQDVVGGSRPIPDLDPSGLAERYGVDPDRPYWVSDGSAALVGRWSKTPRERSAP